jgi:hypothetical protein
MPEVFLARIAGDRRHETGSCRPFHGLEFTAGLPSTRLRTWLYAVARYAGFAKASGTGSHSLVLTVATRALQCIIRFAVTQLFEQLIKQLRLPVHRLNARIQFAVGFRQFINLILHFGHFDRADELNL